MTDLIRRIVSDFHQRFNAAPLLVQAPGRINLIGEHVDYNNGFVLPGAIDKHFVFAVAPNQSDQCRIYASDLAAQAEFNITELKSGHQWFNYFMGVVAGFVKRGSKISGVDCVFGGTIPAGGGLSSSAALCCGFGLALDEIFQAGMARLDLALIAQYAEHEFAGVKCGLMDQYASLFGERDSLLLLDCRSNTHEVIPFPSTQCTIILVDTQVKHALASSAYNDRRAACEEGVDRLKSKFPWIKSLRDVAPSQLEEGKSFLSPEVYQRCLYVVHEMVRTQSAARALREGNLGLVGALMVETHRGLSEEYEVSCAELDQLASTAQSRPDLVIGSRMMGGGFGGCTINLVRPGSEESFKTLVSNEYFTSFKTTPEFHTMALAMGVHRLNP